MTTTTHQVAELARELHRSITEMRSYLRRYLQVKIKEHQLDISFELVEILAYLWRKDGVNQQEIADIIFKDKSSTTYLIDNLVKRNLVKREKDGKDRRNKLIYLTAEGKQLQQQFYPLVIEMFEKATQGIQAAAMERALLLMNKMNDNLKQVL